MCEPCGWIDFLTDIEELQCFVDGRHAQQLQAIYETVEDLEHCTVLQKRSIRRLLGRTVLTLAIGSLALISPISSQAHPGRLNSDGCHFVQQDWRYKNGRELKKGSYHCHRGEKMKLDGFEMLLDPNDPGTPKELKHEKSS